MMATFPIVTIRDYVDAYQEASITTGLFFNSTEFSTLDSTVFSTANQTKIRALMSNLFDMLRLNTWKYSDDITTVNSWIYAKIGSVANANVTTWHNKAVALAKLTGLTEDDILYDFNRSRVEQEAAASTVDGTQKRNSFNSATLEPTAGSHTEAADNASRNITESGTNRPKAEQIRLFYESAEMISLIDDIVRTFMQAIAIMVY